MRIIWYAMNVYYDRKDEWNNIIDNGMAVDYSWNVSADRYINMYQELTGIYDLPEKKTTDKPVKKTASKKKDESLFEKTIKANAEASAIAAAAPAKEPMIVKIDNPFGETEKEPVKKKSTKTAASKKTAEKKTAAVKTAPKTSASKKTTSKTSAAKKKSSAKAGGDKKTP